MTIDEAIAQYQEKAEYFKTTTNVAYALELKQIAEWLEELKMYRESSYGELYDMVYNKAIDDFSKVIKNSYIEKYIDKIAYTVIKVNIEQLKADKDNVSFTSGNADNITEAVHGLDIFTKNWCMNCAETDKTKDLVFRCKNCEFETEKGECLVKMFANKHKHNYPLSDFGSMGSH